MKKAPIILSLVFAVTISPVNVYAHDTAEDHTHSVDDTSIEEKLKEQGLDKAPDVVEVPESQMLGEAPSSGYVDDNGNALSQEEYEAMQDENEGIFKKNPAFLLLLLLPILGAGALLAGLIVFVKSRSKK